MLVLLPLLGFRSDLCYYLQDDMRNRGFKREMLLRIVKAFVPETEDAVTFMSNLERSVCCFVAAVPICK